MSNIWITGACGFIGRHLSRALADQGHHVIGLGHGAFPPEIASQHGLSHWINGEIDPHNLQQILLHSGSPTTIFHLAGGSSVGASLQTPAEDFRRSVASTSALLEWIRVTVPEVKLVVSSSAAVYGNSSYDYIPEKGDFIPYSPYGFHKRAAELMCESYAQAFGLQVAIVRLFSVYGPGLCKQLLWDTCCRLQKRPEVLTMQGTGDEVRDWLYVSDAVKILTAASLTPDPSLIVNGGTGVGTCVRDIITMLCQAIGHTPPIQFSGQKRSGDPFSLVADISHLQTLQIELTTPITSGLEKYAHWFQNFQAN
jgi:UDP-glucose 4-epimerase